MAYGAGGSPRPRPARPSRGRANPGDRTGERGAWPAGPEVLGVWGQWASSWCITREFLKGEVSGATGQTWGAVVGGESPPRL